MPTHIYKISKNLSEIFDIQHIDVEIPKLNHSILNTGEYNIMKKIRTNSGSFKKGVSIPKTKEWKKNISKALIGNKNGTAKHLNEVKLACPHCGLVTTRGNLARWHNDKCKSKL